MEEHLDMTSVGGGGILGIGILHVLSSVKPPIDLASKLYSPSRREMLLDMMG